MKTRLVLAWVIANAGCAMTATMREGPARPAAELATVDSRDTIIAEVDGKDVRYIRADANAGSVYLLPAGPHVIGFSLRMRSGGPGHILRSPYIRVCLLAEAGHYYTTTAEVAVDTWRPHIIDGAGGEVPLTCDQTEAEIVDLWSQAKIERQKSQPCLVPPDRRRCGEGPGDQRVADRRRVQHRRRLSDQSDRWRRASGTLLGRHGHIWDHVRLRVHEGQL